MIKEEIVKLLETALKKMRVNPVTTSLRSKHFHDHSLMNTHLSLGSHPELSGYGVKDIVVTVETPANSIHGDYSSNLALKLIKILKKNPFQIAQEIVNYLPKSALIEEVEIVKPGFINFWIAKKYLINELNQVINKKDDYGKSNLFLKQKIMVEFTDPNPFKEFHLGHLYSNTVGESIARLHEALGAIVKRANYEGDVGLHVAKAIYGIIKKMQSDKLTLDGLAKKKLNDRVKFMGQGYALGVNFYENDGTIKKEIIELNKKIYALDPSIKELYELGRQWTLDYFETIYKRLGTKFDYYYFEREIGKKGLTFVLEYFKKGVFSRSNGAIIFEGEKYGLHTRVFINSIGLPTYEAKDLGLSLTKFANFQYDKSIIVVGNEIKEYFKVVLKALELINPELSHKTNPIFHGMVNLPQGKMSSRTGNIITAEGLLSQVTKQVSDLVSNNSRISLEEKDNTVENITIGATKYSLLKNGIGKDIVFDVKKTLSLDGNSGPYLHYVYARCQSIINNSDGKIKSVISDSGVIDQEEMTLLRTISRFPETVVLSTTNLSPNLIANYLFELAQEFNSFYQKCPILKAPDDKKYLRLQITKAVGQIIKNGLYLLGIKTVEKM